MKMIATVSLLLVCLIILLSGCESESVSGDVAPGITIESRIVDQDGKPISGCKVTLTDLDSTTLTGPDGHFSFTLDTSTLSKFESYDYVELKMESHGFDDWYYRIYNLYNLDSLITLPGRGISVKTAVPIPSQYRVGDTLKIFAVHRIPGRAMRVEFDSLQRSTWFRPQGSACLAETRFEDTCRFVLPSRFPLPRKDGKGSDSVLIHGGFYTFRVVEIGNDSIYGNAKYPLSIFKKPEPYFEPQADLKVSIGDAFTMVGGVKDYQNEPLSFFWEASGVRKPAPDGKALFQAPDKGDTTLDFDFIVARPDESEYRRTAKVTVVWDYPTVIPQKDTVVSIHRPIVFRATARDEYGKIQFYEWDFGNRGNWIRTETDSVVFPGLDTLQKGFEVGVRVTDDDGLSSRAVIKADFVIPFLFQGSGAFISDVVPVEGKRTLFVGQKNYKVLLGVSDSMGRPLWVRELSRNVPAHADDKGSAQVLLNQEGGITVLTRANVGSTTSEFRLLKTSLEGDSIQESSIPAGYLAQASYFLQATDGDYVIVYTEAFNGWMARTDSQGKLRWKAKFATFENFNHVQEVGNGNVVVTGKGLRDNVNAKSRGAATEITPTGLTVWSRTYDYARTEFQRIFPFTGGFLILGSQYSPITPYYWGLRIDSAGVVQDTLSVSASPNSYLTDAIRTSDGGFMLLGNFDASSQATYGFLFTKLGASLGVQWTKAISTSVVGDAQCIHEVDGGGFMAGGTSHGPMLLPLEADGAVR